uniref:Cadherin domain-containing protein n=1 Tax=Poecilia reticulata TaxID=8081 RepID=A0A3P9N6B8_POERE
MASNASLLIQILDENDNPPVFQQHHYRGSICELAPVNSVVLNSENLPLVIKASDADSNQNALLVYQIVEETAKTFFTVDSVTGSIRTIANLDHETFSAFHFHVNVRDNGKPQLIADRIPFDREERDFYELIVEARHCGDPPLSSTITFPITVVNKAMPVFDKSFYSVSVNEDLDVHTPILGVNATSPDGQNIIYTIVDGDASFQFGIGFDTGVISVINSLDYEETPYYRLTIRATNYLTGSHTVMIGTPALQVIATDMDSEKNNVVGYQIFSKEHNSTDYFHIDSSSGLILTARILDHELVPEYDFIVRATDNGFPSLSTEVSVTVLLKDMNDNPPVFNQLLYEAYVSELAPKGHFITCVQASDADSSDFDKLVYSILSGNERMDFVMERNTGIIMLSSHLKQRMEPTYNLNVSVSDGVFTSTAQVHVKVFGANLHDPVFEQKMFEAELRENSAVGTNVIQVGAFEIH